MSKVPSPKITLKDLATELAAIETKAHRFMEAHRGRVAAIDELRQRGAAAVADISREKREAAELLAEVVIPDGSVSLGNGARARAPSKNETDALADAVDIATKKARIIELEQITEIREDVTSLNRGVSSFIEATEPEAANTARRSLMLLAAIGGDTAAERTYRDSAWRSPSLGAIARALSTVREADQIGKVTARVEQACRAVDGMYVATRELEKKA